MGFSIYQPFEGLVKKKTQTDEGISLVQKPEEGTGLKPQPLGQQGVNEPGLELPKGPIAQRPQGAAEGRQKLPGVGIELELPAHHLGPRDLVLGVIGREVLYFHQQRDGTDVLEVLLLLLP